VSYLNGGPQSAQYLTFNQTFSYDGVNRLATASDSGGWGRTFGYDSSGNAWVTGNGGVTLAGTTPTANVFNSNNQIVGTSYDAAGNQLLVNGDTLAYDAEGRQKTATAPASLGGGSETYVYDGAGQRVEKTGPGGTTMFIYDALGQLAAEYATVANTSPCTTCYLSYDHLGSTRLVTDASATVIARHDYLPYGEAIGPGVAGRTSRWGAGNDTINQKFTGQERDTETGIDFFQARYYGQALDGSLVRIRTTPGRISPIRRVGMRTRMCWAIR
jgi:YD repeat-containing protein